jgi:hypothetical protein
MQDGVSQGVILCPTVCVRDDDSPLRLRTSDVFHDWQHSRDTCPSAGQQQRRLCWGQYEVTGWGADIEQISDFHLIMEIAGNAAVRGSVHSSHAPHSDL